MQCTNYIPLPYTTKDVTVGGNSDTCSLKNCNQTSKSRHDYNLLFPSYNYNVNQSLAHDKEVLKQTMLKHEAIFTVQVHELHRLYNRQRELMNDLKQREIGLCQKQLDVCSSQLESESSAQKGTTIPSLPWIKTILSGPSVLAAKNLQASSSSDSPLTETNSKQFELFSSKSKKSEKRMLDLELPADEYIDSEEDSLVRKSNDLVDLNRPIQVDGNDLYCNNCARNVNSCLCTLHQIVPTSYVAKSEPSSVSYGRKPFANLNHIPVEVQALPLFKYPASLSWISKLSAGNQGFDDDMFHINKNSPNNSTVESVGSARDLRITSTEDQRVIGNGENNNLLGFGNLICLNSSVKEHESVLKSSVPSAVIKTETHIDLKAPVSPENNECSPPRGESEEQQLPKQEDTDPQAKFAAEVLVSISKCATFSPSEASSDCLLWFAGVVSSLKCDLKNDFKNSCKSKSITSTRKAAGTISLPSKHRKGRGKRRVRQKKDFQADILPSLASLSKHEAKEDLRLFGGLLEAAGTPLGTSLKRKNATKNGSSSRKRKQQTNGKEVKFLEECLTGWGKINKRPRKNRVPASNPSFTFQMGGVMGK